MADPTVSSPPPVTRTARSHTHRPPLTEYALPPLEPRPHWRRRLFVGSTCAALSVAALGIGIASISYRLTHITVRDGLLNGRTVRVQAPQDGTIEAFYARPGVSVQAGQVLAQLRPMTVGQSGPAALGIPLSAETLTLRLDNARQMLALLNQQMQALDQQTEALQVATAATAQDAIIQADATVDAAVAEATVARTKYERFAALLSSGAVSQQSVDELQANWQAAEASVQQARAEQNTAQIEASTSDQPSSLASGLKDLQKQRRQLLQDIQIQQHQINLLELEQQAQTAAITAATDPATPEADTLLANTGSTVPITAPFGGVVYTTHHETGEQVNRPTAMLSLLDCNVLWVEALISADQAKQINAAQPVRVQIANHRETVVGQVEFINAMRGNETTQARAEALLPAIPAHLVGRPIARVRVQIPAIPVQAQAYQFCGVGQPAQMTFATHSQWSNWWGRLGG